MVAASVSERTNHHSLTLVATSQPRRSKPRGIEPKANENASRTALRIRSNLSALPIPSILTP